ncbi:MAG: phosphatidylserine decarboxylase family protein [Candidatus Neomarinimicrobiota bacterium]
MVSPRLPIAKQAWVELSLSTAAFLTAGFGLAIRPSVVTAVLAAFLGTLWAALILFFRDPERHPPSELGIFTAPADGRVMEVTTTEEPTFIKGQAAKIAIFMSLLNVHVNRAPAHGSVEWIQHVPGKFLAAFRPEAATRNEHNLIGMLHDGQRILVRQIAGILARRIVCSVKPGDTLYPGQRLGMVKFGSRVEVFLPQDVQPTVAVGDQVRGGSTIIARRSS